MAPRPRKPQDKSHTEIRRETLSRKYPGDISELIILARNVDPSKIVKLPPASYDPSLGLDEKSDYKSG
jgi:hypothetical protein